MANGQEAIDLLKSIDASLKLLVRQQVAGAPKPVATDRDLDSKWGDPELKFSPRDWAGPSFKGRRFSECPADLLDMIAESCEFFARQADAKNERTDKGKPVADYRRTDAMRARGWAQRIRQGKLVQGEPVGVGSSAEWARDGDDSFS